MQTTITISNKLGLHARAAAKLVGTSNQFQSQISIACKGKTANAKSIMAIMMLAASMGTEIVITAEGEDAQDAIDALTKLINDKFGEDN